jgi:predicted membrane protein
MMITNPTNFNSHADAKAPPLMTQKCGGLASFLLAMTFIIAPSIYLFGNLRDPFGPFSYALADFLYGPVWAASLVTVVFTLREQLGERAPRRMSLALWAAVLAAGAMVAVACIRSANRHYHMIHPELHLETSSTVLIVWTTLVAGLTAVGWHFLGWAWVLVGSSGWTTRRLPRLLSALYLIAGVTSLFVYLLPENEGIAVTLGLVISIWQGILFWKTQSGARRAPETNEGPLDRA